MSGIHANQPLVPFQRRQWQPRVHVAGKSGKAPRRRLWVTCLNSRTDGGRHTRILAANCTYAGQTVGRGRRVQEPELTAKARRDCAYSIPATFLERSHPVNKYVATRPRRCLAKGPLRPAARTSPAPNGITLPVFPPLANRRRNVFRFVIWDVLNLNACNGGNRSQSHSHCCLSAGRKTPQESHHSRPRTIRCILTAVDCRQWLLHAVSAPNSTSGRTSSQIRFQPVHFRSRFTSD
jgi:hypothetical protein